MKVPIKDKVKSMGAGEGVLSVSKTVLGQERSTREKIKIRPFVTDTATVSVKFGATIPTQQYANIRVDVMISVPCYVEEMFEVFHQVRDMVDLRMQEELDRLLNDKAGGKGGTANEVQV